MNDLFDFSFVAKAFIAFTVGLSNHSNLILERHYSEIGPKNYHLSSFEEVKKASPTCFGQIGFVWLRTIRQLCQEEPSQRYHQY